MWTSRTSGGQLIDLKLVAKHLGQAAADRDLQAADYLLARRLEGQLRGTPAAVGRLRRGHVGGSLLSTAVVANAAAARVGATPPHAGGAGPGLSRS
jgi:hypothetical protein